MTRFLDKSFSVYQSGGQEYRDRWEETFGKKNLRMMPDGPEKERLANELHASEACPHAPDCQAMLGNNDDSACDCDGRVSGEASASLAAVGQAAIAPLLAICDELDGVSPSSCPEDKEKREPFLTDSRAWGEPCTEDD